MVVANHRAGTLVEVFHDEVLAQAAIRELKAVGFRESQIGVISRTIVTIKAGTRTDIASCILNRFIGADQVLARAL